MKPNALSIYVCPACKSALELTCQHQEGGEILEGQLDCCRCGVTYPIRRGVPRFVGSGDYASSFGQQWNWFRHVQLDSYNQGDRSRRMLAETTGWGAADFTGRLVLDAGVGAGRYAECAAAQGGRVFGVDLTCAVDAAFESIGRRENVNLAQADIFALPFREASFDLAYSIGVLHHTPDPEAAFGHVASVVRPSGQFAVYLYARHEIQDRLSDLARVVTTRLPTRLMLLLSTWAIPAYFVQKIPVIGTAMRLVLPVSDVPDWRWRWLDTFDWYTPKYQFKFVYPEVFHWFQSYGFHDVVIFDGPIRMRGVKAAETETTETDAADYLRRMVASKIAETSAAPATAAGEIDAPSGATGRLAFGALLVFTVVLIGAPQEQFRVLAPLRLAMVSAVLALAAHLMAVLSGGRTGQWTPAGLTIAALLLGWTVVTIPLSTWPGGSISVLLDVFLKSLIVFWLLARVVNSVDRLYRLAVALSLLSVLIALTGIKNYLSGAFMFGRVVGYNSGLAGNPNDLALTLDILLPISLALVVTGRSRWMRALAAGAAALSITAIVVTFSRGGFLGLSVIALFSLFWLVRLGHRGVVIGAIAVTLCLAPLIPSGYLERLQTVSSVDSDPTGSAQQRWRDMVISVRFIAQHPVLGAGLGMDVLALNDLRGRAWKSVHDVYLEYGVDLGLPGLALYLILIVASIGAVWRVERDRRDATGDRRLLAIAGAIRISLIAFATAAVFYPVAYHFYFYYLAGLAAAARTLHASSAPAA